MAVAASEKLNHNNFEAIFKNYLELYNSVGKEKQFYQLSHDIKEYYLDKGMLDEYYKTELNELLYDNDHGHSYEAMQKANDMLQKMRNEGYNHFEIVYAAMGNIFELRGCRQMAQHYYLEAIDNTDPRDEITSIGMYSQMATLLMFTEPNKADKWNEKYASSSLQYPHYHQLYLFIKTMIAFARNERDSCMAAASAYTAYHKANEKQLEDFGKTLIECVREACKNNYDKSLQLLETANNTIDSISLNDLRIIICKQAGRYEQALYYAKQNALRIDSLNTDLFINNINQLYADTNLAKLQAKTNKRNMLLVTIVLILAFIIIALLVVYASIWKKNRKQLTEKNKQLQTALSMAEESDKMKTEFVRNVSHEIRTPLNAINGFNEILNNNDIELSEEEKRNLLERIELNVKSITNIIDEMLQMAEKKSANFYNKTDTILPNQLLSALIYSRRNSVSANIELYYTTKVINRFSIQTNEEGLRNIVNQLINNAIKFTSKGYIELHCEESPDKKHLLISVTDTGSGIMPEEQDKIFEQFFKADAFSQGIGLGLTVSKKIAQKLGGDLILDKTYTQGSRFILSLPIG
jgi:signal transduction histidine kinase